MLRQALSGVARMSWKRPDGSYEGRYGKGRIIAMLTGSRSREILEAKLDQLTTYGCLKTLGASALQNLFIEMERHGLVEISGGEFPKVSLTPSGIEVMRSGTAARLRWPSAPTPVSSALKSDSKTGDVTIGELGWDEALFNKLKRLRNALAEADGKPPYTVFSNQTLEFLTRLQPTTVDAALKIRGIGPAKAQSVLPEFLKLIKQHKTS